jgi:hypothetical protein
MPWQRPAFGSPFELWLEEDVLHLVLAKRMRMGTAGIKELIRLVTAMDTSGTRPVLIECPDDVAVGDDGWRLLRRACRAHRHAIAFVAIGHPGRAQGELFKRMQATSVPVRVFTWRADAFRWARERRQLAMLTARS